MALCINPPHSYSASSRSQANPFLRAAVADVEKKHTGPMRALPGPGFNPFGGKPPALELTVEEAAEDQRNGAKFYRFTMRVWAVALVLLTALFVLSLRNPATGQSPDGRDSDGAAIDEETKAEELPNGDAPSPLLGFIATVALCALFFGVAFTVGRLVYLSLVYLGLVAPPAELISNLPTSSHNAVVIEPDAKKPKLLSSPACSLPSEDEVPPLPLVLSPPRYVRSYTAVSTTDIEAAKQRSI